METCLFKEGECFSSNIEECYNESFTGRTGEDLLETSHEEAVHRGRRLQVRGEARMGAKRTRDADTCKDSYFIFILSLN